MAARGELVDPRDDTKAGFCGRPPSRDSDHSEPDQPEELITVKTGIVESDAETKPAPARHELINNSDYGNAKRGRTSTSPNTTERIPMKKAITLILSAACMAGLLAGCGTSASTHVSDPAISVSITAPSNGQAIKANAVVVRGTVTPTNASVLVDGQPAVVGNGVFTASITLSTGSTTIDVIGSEAGDTPGSASVTVTRPAASKPNPAPTPTTPTTTVVQPPVTITQPTPTPTPVTSMKYCDQNIQADTSTTCGLADNVFTAYWSTGSSDTGWGSTTISAWSDASQQSFDFSCFTDQTTVTCTQFGADANPPSVATFPMSAVQAY
jgi:hypothetical protein